MHYFTMQSGARVTLALLLIVAGTPAAGLAQSATTPPGTVRPGITQPGGAARKTRTWTDPAIATRMLVDALGYADARAVVIRRPGEMPNNIILVTRATTPAELAHAASALIISRRSRGDQVDREIRALIGAPPVRTIPAPARRGPVAGGGATRQAGKPSGSARQAASDLQRLRSAPVFTIAGIGRGPALVIRMSDTPPPTTKR